MKKLVLGHKHFLMRAINLVLLLAIVLVYQNLASVRAKEDAAIEAKNAEILAEAAAGAYSDGIYQGSAAGFGGDIVVEVTVKDGNIAKIDILSHDGEDDEYFNNAKSLTEDILAAQSTDVDTVSGATYSSNGIIGAVNNALEEAE